MRAAVGVAALGVVALLAGCNDINPYLGAQSTNASEISYITPSSRPAGCSGFTLDVHGEGFVSGAVINWNNSPRATDFESAGEMLATINDSDVATQTPVSIVVSTPGLTGQQNQGNNLSNFVPFTITAPVTQGSCPAPPAFVPSITGLSVPEAVVGTSVQIAGNYFGGTQNTSTVTFNGTLATVSAWTGTLITVTVPTGATSGDVIVTVNGVASVDVNTGNNYFTVLQTAPTASFMKRLSALANTTYSFSSTAAPRYATLVAPSTGLSAAAGAGVDKIYLRDTCQGAPAGCSPASVLVSAALDSADPNGASRSPSVSASGRFVAFASDASNLVQGDANGVADIFVRDTCLGARAGCVPATTRISVGPDGVESNGASASPSISFDGRFVAFDSAATNLVSDGASGGAFLWDTCFAVPKASGCTPSLTRLSVSSVAPH